MDMEREMRLLNDKMNGITAAMESGFVGLRKDVQYMSTYGKPALAVAIVAAIMACMSLFIALDNRNLIMQNSVNIAKNSRDLENIFPLVFGAPGPTPETPESSQGK